MLILGFPDIEIWIFEVFRKFGWKKMCGQFKEIWKFSEDKKILVENIKIKKKFSVLMQFKNSKKMVRVIYLQLIVTSI